VGGRGFRVRVRRKLFADFSNKILSPWTPLIWYKRTNKKLVVKGKAI
jgi:hypothetical protein